MFCWGLFCRYFFGFSCWGAFMSICNLSQLETPKKYTFPPCLRESQGLKNPSEPPPGRYQSLGGHHQRCNKNPWWWSFAFRIATSFWTNLDGLKTQLWSPKSYDNLDIARGNSLLKAIFSIGWGYQCQNSPRKSSHIEAVEHLELPTLIWLERAWRGKI